MIPVFNREDYIADCIQSALDQTIVDYEIVIVDNASTDKTWDICRNFASCDPRIRIFRNKENIGPVRNWRRCFDEARGVYGKLLFSDDLIYPSYLEKTLPYLENPQIGFVFTAVEIGAVPGMGRLDFFWEAKADKIPSIEFIESILSGKNCLASPGAGLFRMDDLRNNLRLEIPSPSFHDFQEHGAGPDLLLYLLTASMYPFVAYIYEPLAFFRIHENSITIKKKSDFCSVRYLQTKIWFAYQNADTTSLKYLLAKAWIKECIRLREILAINEFSRRYVKEEQHISTSEIIWVCLDGFYRKILTFFKN